MPGQAKCQLSACSKDTYIEGHGILFLDVGNLSAIRSILRMNRNDGFNCIGHLEEIAGCGRDLD